MPNVGDRRLSARSQGISHLTAPTCARGITRRFRTREFNHQPNTPGLVEIAQGLDLESRFGQQLPKRLAVVPAKVVQVFVQRAVDGRHCRDEQHQVATIGKHSGKIGQRLAIVLDVLEHVHAHDRVNLLGGQIRTVVRREREPERGDADIGSLAERPSQLLHVVRLDVRGDDSIAFDKIPRLVAHA